MTNNNIYYNCTFGHKIKKSDIRLIRLYVEGTLPPKKNKKFRFEVNSLYIYCIRGATPCLLDIGNVNLWKAVDSRFLLIIQSPYILLGKL